MSDTETIDKLFLELSQFTTATTAKELQQAARIAALEGALRRSDYDISPCGTCGEPVVCIPDGMAPECRPCHDKALAEGGGDE